MDQEKLDNQLDEETNEETTTEIDLPKTVEQEKLHAIEIQLQEIEIQIDQLDIKISLTEEKDQYLEEYYDLKNQYNELLRQKKLQKKAIKSSSGSNWDQVHPWVLIYGVIISILCLPYLGMIIWSSFAGWFTSLFSGLSALQNDSYPLFVVVLLLIYYSLPLILLLITWILSINVVRDGFERKVFKYIWIGQTILTIGNSLYLFFEFILPTL